MSCRGPDVACAMAIPAANKGKDKQTFVIKLDNGSQAGGCDGVGSAVALPARRRCDSSAAAALHACCVEMEK